MSGTETTKLHDAFFDEEAARQHVKDRRSDIRIQDRWKKASVVYQTLLCILLTLTLGGFYLHIESHDQFIQNFGVSECRGGDVQLQECF